MLALLEQHWPSSQWARKQCPTGARLLHYAAGFGGNKPALVALLLARVDVNAVDNDGSAAAHWAAWHGNVSALELLVVAGANLQLKDASGNTPLDDAIHQKRADCTRMLLVNGARLQDVRDIIRCEIAPWMVQLGARRVNCRKAVVGLLGIKMRGDTLRALDRFLVKELAFVWWATRGDPGWQLLSLLDWKAVHAASCQGGLLTFLEENVPRVRWHERDEDGDTLLHYAAQGPNADAAVALIKEGLDVNARAPVCVAAQSAQPHVLEVLCIAGADLRATRKDGKMALDFVLELHPGYWDPCASVLIANGMRLMGMYPGYDRFIPRWMVLLEQGRLCCRAVIVTLMGLKRRRRGYLMQTMDRWLVREISWSVWATRTQKEWCPQGPLKTLSCNKTM